MIHNQSNATSIILGHERFVKFSAVEGIKLSPRLEDILKTLNERQLEGEERLKLMKALLAQTL